MVYAEQKNYSYLVRIEIDILANREQEYIRRCSKNDMFVDDYESEFNQYDFYNSKRWIRDKTETFCVETLEEIDERIELVFCNCHIGTALLVEGKYFYWFENNCLVNQNRMLHRALVNIQHKSDVEMTEEDMRRIEKRVREKYAKIGEKTN